MNCERFNLLGQQQDYRRSSRDIALATTPISDGINNLIRIINRHDKLKPQILATKIQKATNYKNNTK